MRDMKPLSALSWCIALGYSLSAGIIVGATGHDFYDIHFLIAWAGIPIVMLHCEYCDRAERRTR